MRNMSNANNICERLNGEFKDRINTAREFNLKPDKKTDGSSGADVPHCCVRLSHTTTSSGPARA